MFCNRLLQGVVKEYYNALVPEHKAFLKKKAAAAPYVKAVRTYLEKQQQQEHDRQYRERKLTKQKNNTHNAER